MQKTVIEGPVEEMLNKGIIQHNSSPYAALVVLVGQKDGIWRLCIDHRELNKQTIKDRLPIPVIEDLLDEVGRATVFTKLDLRLGGRDITSSRLLMFPPAVFKTVSKTHSSIMGFLLMPFDLTNAPTSQHLMNDLFRLL